MYDILLYARKLLTLALFPCVFFNISMAKAGSGETILYFSAKFIASSCDVSVTKSNISFSPATFSEIKSAGSMGFEPQNFTLKFAKCQGQGATPKIQIKGNNFISGITLFRDNSTASNYSKGYGIKLVKKGSNTALKNLEKISIGSLSQDLSKNPPTSLDLTASLSCGTCDKSSVNSGVIKSVVTFQFIYE